MRQRLEEVFEQAVWRQPSVILLDDLDHMAGAATTPEQEQFTEAVLHHHIAQSILHLKNNAKQNLATCLKVWSDGDSLCVSLCFAQALRI